MANKHCLPVSMKGQDSLSFLKICSNSHPSTSQLSTEDSDISPVPRPSLSVHSLYHDLSSTEETKAKALTCSLQLVSDTLEAELDPVNLRERKNSGRSCPLQGVGNSPLMQRRSQRLSLQCSVVT